VIIELGLWRIRTDRSTTWPDGILAGDGAPLSPLVEALQALRGVELTGAIIVLAELGDITRFETPRQLMSYLGLTPSEYSSRDRRRQGEDGAPHEQQVPAVFELIARVLVPKNPNAPARSGPGQSTSTSSTPTAHRPGAVALSRARRTRHPRSAKAWKSEPPTKQFPLWSRRWSASGRAVRPTRDR
jgi:Transposase IS116/IS110/IS902 family